MAQIPNTQKKLRETKFFLGNLSKAARSPHLDREDFDFYLSAFLSAGRSVTLFLQYEQKASYDIWFMNWCRTLGEGERKLLEFSNAQRVAAVHKQAPEIQSDIEMMPLTKFEAEYKPNNISWMTSGCFGPPGIPTPEMGVMVYYFEIEGKKEKVIDICKQYLALLERLVQELDQAFP